MLKISKCCCCTVKTGSQAFGSLYLFCSVISFGDGIKGYILGDNRSSDADISDLSNELEITKSQAENFYLASAYIDFVTLVLNLGYIICSSLLLAGIHKQEPKFVFPIIAFLPIDCLTRLCFIITYSAVIGFLHPLTIVINLMFGLVVVAGFFVWLCFYSYYQELKDPSLQDAGVEMRPV